ncbi:MAG: hypothetical protein US86_C0002G0003 [Candidatus Daviesbacteria bacterium GW2011_GWA2_38_24]|uniref:Uncharacterized protein n=1 Tax=Candidatus Daviesbacteria bacterium GW2011_GWA2_38_24 TaxID=1618422 RepID=A0A0G0MPN6_9BACT|nr:MAG: hypothetical protein US86_C0002G0003 [Candidatus Daviesbacteria bacterium GW2011_GWA2_38_24]KKQ79055.1 MAG: hypothetical protein UT01_C0052G0002 [Candidatus Daviesbacteria bacterium GW2011_GWA1_38_7]OGE24288.1 MAG: hypothetical protein A2688_03155 [Candidatus Daviesbacteria bacterium RIFCSPHIGHO2_01_FULL_38_8]
MPSDSPFVFTNLLGNFWIVLEIGTILFAGLYFIFSLMVVRQVKLMTQTLINQTAPLLRALSILHSGFSLGLLILLIGFLLT